MWILVVNIKIKKYKNTIRYSKEREVIKPLFIDFWFLLNDCVYIIMICNIIEEYTCAVCKYLDLDMSFYFANDLQLMDCCLMLLNNKNTLK